MPGDLYVVYYHQKGMRHLGNRHPFEHPHKKYGKYRHARRKNHHLKPIVICHVLSVEIRQKEYSERIEEEIKACRYVVYHSIVYVEESDDEKASRQKSEKPIEHASQPQPRRRPKVEKGIYRYRYRESAYRGIPDSSYPAGLSPIGKLYVSDV